MEWHRMFFNFTYNASNIITTQPGVKILILITYLDFFNF